MEISIGFRSYVLFFFAMSFLGWLIHRLYGDTPRLAISGGLTSRDAVKEHTGRRRI